MISLLPPRREKGCSMIRAIPSPVSVSAVAALLVLQACSAGTDGPDAGTGLSAAQKASQDDAVAHDHATIKPGAALTFRHGEVDKVAPGENGSVTVTIEDGYDAGSLEVRSTGSDGLSVFGAQATARFDMAGADAHSVRLAYTAETAGTYYINMMGSVNVEGEAATLRAYAVRVVIGDAAAVATKPVQEMMVLPDGRAAVLLPAEETFD